MQQREPRSRGENRYLRVAAKREQVLAITRDNMRCYPDNLAVLPHSRNHERCLWERELAFALQGSTQFFQ